MSLLLTLLTVFRQIAGKFAQLADAATIREKVLIGFDIATELAAATPTPADDAVVAFVDQLGRDKAADLITAALGLFGIDDTPGPFGEGLEASPVMGADPDDSRDMQLAGMASEAGVALPTLITVLTTITTLIQYAPVLIDLFRRRKAA